MKKIILSSFAKITLSTVVMVAVFSCVVTIYVKVSEKQINKANNTVYNCSSINGSYSTMLEGGYWQLETIQDSLQQKTTSVSFKDPLLTIGLLHDLGASYGYSYCDKRLASFWPMSDAKTVLASWIIEWYLEPMTLGSLVSSLRDDNAKLSRGTYSESYAEFCKIMGCPLPCVALIDYETAYYSGDVTNTLLGSTTLTIASIDANQMVLKKDGISLLYKRVKAFPYKIAPISVYYQFQK